MGRLENAAITATTSAAKVAAGREGEMTPHHPKDD